MSDGQRSSESSLPPEAALYFRDQFRKARAAALRDAEAFEEILFVLERLGSYLSNQCNTGKKGHGDLTKYRPSIARVAGKSLLARRRNYHTPFCKKYDIVREARNGALHQGAFARHLTLNAVDLSLILEEALMSGSAKVRDFMVRDPVCAELWQPLSLVRQAMLVNSFSYLPVREAPTPGTKCRLVSDFELAKYLRADKDKTESRLSETLMEASADRLQGGRLELRMADPLFEEEEVTETFQASSGLPIVVLAKGPSGEPVGPVGILTPFDLL